MKKETQALPKSEINTELMFFSVPIHLKWDDSEEREKDDLINFLKKIIDDYYFPLKSGENVIGVINKIQINEQDLSLKAYGFMWVDLGMDVTFNKKNNNYIIDNININPLSFLSQELLNVMKNIKEVANKLNDLDKQYELTDIKNFIDSIFYQKKDITEEELKEFITKKQQEKLKEENKK